MTVLKQSQNVTIRNASGLGLSARLELPDGPLSGLAMIAPAFGCTKDILIASRTARRLLHYGIGSLRLDFTGIGQSQGDFSLTNLDTQVEDFVSAADWLRQQAGAPDILIGHSFGGLVALDACSQISGVKACVTIATPESPAHVLDIIGAEKTREIEQVGATAIEVNRQPYTLRRQFADNARQFQISNTMRRLKVPLMIMHSPRDDMVPMRHAYAIFDAAPQPKSLLAIEDADHMVYERSAAEFVADTIALWSRRYFAAD
ncbi:alpha/beta hydrolase [Methylobacillus sp. Pita2]|uniref:alpha/beta hydrolase n=1 Tax=Methylobacillus sp. Pita2 TaxID=3383245 RepID=UPI0038B59D4C